MGFISRAFKNATRRLSKSLLLMITFFVIGNFVIIGLGVSNASESAKALTRQKMRAIVTYKIDNLKMNDYTETLTEEEMTAFYKDRSNFSISPESLKALLSDSRIKAYNIGSTTIAYEGDFKAVPVGNERETNSSGNGMCSSWDASGAMVEYECSEPSLKIRLELSPNIIDFADGLYVKTEGRMYTQEDIDSEAPVCLITDKFAEHNNLKIGDTIHYLTTGAGEINLEYNKWAEGNADFFKRELEVIGIFDNTEELDPQAEDFNWKSKYDSPENVILVPNSAIKKAQFAEYNARWEYNKTQYPDDPYYSDPEMAPKAEDTLFVSQATLLLNDPLDVEAFADEYSAKETREFMVLDANNETFNKLSKPLDTMSLFANLIVWLVIINAAIIITLVTALTLKTREYEIGVLLSMGVSKGKIVAQFFVELAIIAVIGFSAAVLSGSLAAKSVGETVLEYQVAVSDVKEDDNNNNNYYWGETNYFTEISLDDMISEYEVTISPLIIAEIYIAGLGIVLVSILIPSLMIMRFNPKRILMNTN